MHTPIRLRFKISKSTLSDSTHSNASWLSKSILPKRDPIFAVGRSASVTVLAAETTSLSIPENNDAIHSAKTCIHFEHVIYPTRRAPFAQQIIWRTLGGIRQSRRSRQPALLHRQHA